MDRDLVVGPDNHSEHVELPDSDILLMHSKQGETIECIRNSLAPYNNIGELQAYLRGILDACLKCIEDIKAGRIAG